MTKHNTHLFLDKDTVRKAKFYAIENDRTLTDVVDEAIALFLKDKLKPKEEIKTKLKKKKQNEKEFTTAL